MKLLKVFLTIVISFWFVQANAQIFGNDPEINIDGLQPESVWQIAEMAMNDNQIPIGQLNMKEGVLLSNWFEWKSIAVQNHAHLYFKYEAPTLTVKIADRQYKSSEGWSESVGNLSKKNYKKYVQAVANRITEISKDEALVKEAVRNSKLILAFSPVFTVEGLDFKLMKASKDGNQHLTLEFSVNNTTPEEANVRIPFHGYKEMVNHKTTGGRGNVKWPPKDGWGTVIQAGESRTLICEYPNWEMSTLPQFDIRVQSNSGKAHRLSMYSIPLPYTYQEED